MSEMVAAATGSEVGDLFEYRLKEPVTLRKNQSALVPIVSAPVEVEKVSLWNRNRGTGRPLRAVWLSNTTGLTLDGGSMSIVDSDAFAGEGLIEPLKPGEKRLVSYGADMGMLVDARMDPSPTRIFRVRARDGILIQESEERATWRYRIRNQNATTTTLVVEHPIRSGWKLVDGQKPAESTADTHRFRLSVAPGGEATLDVQEVRPGESRIRIAELTDTMLAVFAQGGIPLPEIQAALKPVLEKRGEVGQLDIHLQQLQQQLEAIARDQERLRENMKALRGSAEEKQLLQRYTRQLDEQETRLDTLKQDVAKTTAARDKAAAELNALIASVSFEVGGK
jgi:hypothetical protein